MNGKNCYNKKNRIQRSNFMRKIGRKQRGITLITLVVTILTLLILATVSIHLITGEQGILKRTTSSIDKHEQATDEEDIRIAIADLNLKYYKEFKTSQNTSKKSYILQSCLDNPISTKNGGMLKVDAENLVFVSKKGITRTVELSEEGDIIRISSGANTSEDAFNVIFMIGDGMGQEHIKAGEINKGAKLYMQTIPNRTQVTTYSFSVANAGAPSTDSAASATALATGVKTWNYYVGKDISQNNVENLTEYCHRLGMKTGVVCTQTLYHATPAGFTTHTSNRNYYATIARRQVTEEEVDLMLGGGQQFFSGTEELLQQVLNEQQIKVNADKDGLYHQDLRQAMTENGYKYITDFSELSKINKNEKVIGAFSWGRLTEGYGGAHQNANPSLVQMTKSALSRLENENGFFMMIEGSDIDTYSHVADMEHMLDELNGFDQAVKVAMDYVDSHPNTLLVVTADHETGGLNLYDASTKDQLSNSLFTNQTGNDYWDHTNNDVAVYSYGKYAEELTKDRDVIDNIEIHNFIKQKLQEIYE